MQGAQAQLQAVAVTTRSLGYKSACMATYSAVLAVAVVNGRDRVLSCIGGIQLGTAEQLQRPTT